jgi:hypothetical protein
LGAETTSAAEKKDARTKNITNALSYHQGTFISPGHFHIRDPTYILFTRQVLRRVSIIAPMSFIAPSVIYCAERLVPQCHLLRRVSIVAPMSFIAPSVIYCTERLVPRYHLLRRVSIIAPMSFIAPSVIYCAEVLFRGVIYCAECQLLR